MPPKKSDSESYTVLEMPIGLKSIRMELAELKRFCNQYHLPLFSLKVEEHVQNSISFPLERPWKKYFTLKWDWCLWASEPVEGTEKKT